MQAGADFLRTNMLATEYELRTLKGIIYLIQNLINNKRYIGQSINTFIYRYSSKWWKKVDNPHLKNAIQKYGYENFSVQILASEKSKEELNVLEMLYINLYKSDDKNFGYNLTNGGASYEKTGTLKDRFGIFLIKALAKFGEKFDYSIGEFKGFKKDMVIKCNDCGYFFTQKPSVILVCNEPCSICRSNYYKTNHFNNLSINDFQDRIISQHKQDYIFDTTKYINITTNLTFFHQNCQKEFSIKPTEFLKADCPCPFCRQSSKAKRIQQIDPVTNNTVNVFKSILHAERELGLKSLSKNFRKIATKNKVFKGFKWNYL